MGIKPRKDEKNKFSIGKICIVSTIGTLIFFATSKALYDFAFCDKRDVKMMMFTNIVKYNKLNCYDEDYRELTSK
jgi:hypothetical protein